MHVVFVIFVGLAVSQRHTYMFSAGDDKMVKCWDLEQNKVRRLRLSIGWRWTPYTFFLHLAIIFQFYLFAFCWRCFSKFSMTLCLGSCLYYDELNLVFENQRFLGAGSACLIAGYLVLNIVLLEMLALVIDTRSRVSLKTIELKH